MLITLPNAFGDAATNMAIDAALLESLPEGMATFRHYGWLEPAVTFGYAQAYAEVRQTAGKDITLCRRLTGGGIVDHRNDWTYALVLHKSLPTTSIPATTLYEHIHRAISLPLKRMGVENHLAPCPKTCDRPYPISRIPYPVSRTPHLSCVADKRSMDPASQCFVMPAANDVLRADGQKIAGAAMKRNRHGLLIQGSIDRGALPDDFDYRSFQGNLIEELTSILGTHCGNLEDIRPLFKSERIEHEKQRFSSDEWNQRR